MQDIFLFIKRNRWSFLLILLLGILTYANTGGNTFVSDDIDLIASNKLISSPSYFLSSPMDFMRPFFYFVIYKIWLLNPVPYHLLNIFFHIGTATGLYVLAVFISKNKQASLIASCIFVVHPAISEGVSWISGGSYPQYSFFLIVSFILYLVRKKKPFSIWFSVFFFMLAFFSSVKSIAFPFLLLMYEVSLGSVKKSWKQLLPFFVLSGVWGILLFLKIGNRVSDLETNYYIGGGRFENPLIKLPFAITTYIQLLILPTRLTLYHSEVIGYWEYILRIFGLVCFLGIFGFFYKKDKQIFFWLSFFLILLLPVLTPLKINSTVAERYMYMASFGLLCAIIFSIQRITSRWRKRIVIGFISGVIIFICMFRTFVRNFDWNDELTLWTATVKTSPNSYSVHNNLGAALARVDRDDEAASQFQAAIKLNPEYADAYKNLGFLFLKHNDPDTALTYYKSALRLNSHNWQFYNDIGAAYVAKKNYAESEKYFLQALQLSPENELLYLNLGRVYVVQHNDEKAKNAFQNVLLLNPANTVAAQFLNQMN